MPASFLAHPFRKRLPRFQTARSWTKLARNPSYLAPRAEDVQSPTPFVGPLGPQYSPSEQRKLDAVLARPDDCALRLAFAEQSKEDSEFIRVQLAIAREFRAGNVPPIELFDREARKLPSQQAKWSEHLAEWGANEFVFRRGFIERLTLTGRSFIALGSTLFDFLPLNGVRLIAVKWYLDELVNCRHLQRLTRLNLSGNRIGSQGLQQLSTSPYLNAITDLDLSGNNLVDDDLLAISRFELRSLRLANNHLTTFDFSRFPKLETLSLSGNRLQELPAIPATLRRLELADCQLSSLPKITESIRELDLSFNPDADVTAHCHEELTALSLRGNRIANISQLPTALPHVRTLDLAANYFGDAIGDWLSQTPLNALTSLDLTNTLITQRGLLSLIDSGRLAKLHSLNLSWNNLGDEAIIALANCPDVSQLRTLDLTGTGIGTRGINALKRSPYLENCNPHFGR